MSELAEPTVNPGPVLRGTPVAPGIAVGPARRPAHDLDKVPVRRVPRDEVEEELNRFRRALGESEQQLDELRERLRGRVPADDVRILDTHVAYLKDSVFLSDVENLVLSEQLALESAIAKVILDFDRIFRLVENEVLRERAVDLRDVGIRVLRNLEIASQEPSDEEQADPGEPETEDPTSTPASYVLVAHELSIVDMFGLEGEPVIAIVTEAGSLTSHAAILARSMRVPTLTGVGELLEIVEDGEELLVDAAEGVVRVRPDPLLVEQFQSATPSSGRGDLLAEARTAEGVAIELTAAAGNLAEVESATDAGIRAVGLYRTELLHLVDREPPSPDALRAHFEAVLERAEGGHVTFRLLDLDASMGVPYLHEARDTNPQLGFVGVRALFAREPLLRRQLSAILQACAAKDQRPRIVIPKVVDCGELRRVKEILFEERYALKKAGQGAPEALVGVVIETPASALAARELAHESDLVMLGLDSLQQYVLATDRDHPMLGDTFLRLHPTVTRLLRSVVDACEDEDVPPTVFGVTAALESNLPLLLGVGLRRFALAPIAFSGFVSALKHVDLDRSGRTAELAERATSPDELDPLLEGYGQGI